MLQILDIYGDSNRWYLADDVDLEALSAQLAKGHRPISVAVTAPLIGQLVIAGRAMASVAALTVAPPLPGGWVPSYVPVDHPVLYLPTNGQPRPDNPGYRLADDQDTKKLTGDIAQAMHDHARLRVDVADPRPFGGYQGAILLDGATLPMAVVCPITPPQMASRTQSDAPSSAFEHTAPA